MSSIAPAVPSVNSVLLSQMKLTLLLLALSVILELSLWLPLVWRLRKVVSSLLVIGLAALSGAIVAVHPRLWTAVIAFFGVYRLLNLLRVRQARLQPDYLRSVVRRSGRRLIALQALVVGLFYAAGLTPLAGSPRWMVLAALQLGMALVLLSSTRRHLRTTTTLGTSHAYADRDLPALSVAVPARNETADLERCLTSLIASDYPKLEILVLDDCSQNQRTPAIIHQFAQSGVRFISGQEPPASWLAKNYAYQQLADATSGELLLFCGVDASFTPDALKNLVVTLLTKNKSMLSVLPRNTPPRGLRAYLVQPVRYAWELSLPRRLFNRPPVLSTCWLVKRQLLQQAGGFKAARRSITPESYLARAASRHDGYSFVRSSLVNSGKPFIDQRQTAVRTRYPQLHRRPELVALLSLAEAACLIGPFILLIVALVGHDWLNAASSGAACLCLVIFFSIVVAVTYRRFTVWSLVLVPLAAAYDIGLLNYSMAKYEFGTVLWKGRNVCLPVMHGLPLAD